MDGAAQPRLGVEVTAVSTFVAFLVIIALHGLLNTFGVNLVKLLSNVSAWWHLVGVGDHRRGPRLRARPAPDPLVDLLRASRTRTGWDAPFYAFLIGLLMAQYTYTGYDASAHVAEETMNASTEAPKGIVRSVWVSILAGWVLLVAVTAAIQDYDAARAAPRPACRRPRSSSTPPGRSLGMFLLFIAAVAQFFCGMASVTANSRMSYAFSRDNALPGSRLWSQVNPRTGTPTNSIWLCVTCSVVLTAPALCRATAYLAVTSIAVIGLYIAYVVPVFLRRTQPGLQCRAVEPRPVERAHRLDRGRLGRLHRHPLHAPGRATGRDRQHLQLRAGRGAGAVLVFATVTWFAGGRDPLHASTSRRGTTPSRPSEIFG